MESEQFEELAAEQKWKRPPLVITPIDMGSRPGLNYDDLESLIEFVEGQEHR